MSASPDPVRRLKSAHRRVFLVKIDLRVALVGGDYEPVAVREFEQSPPLVQRHHVSRRIRRRAGVQQLRAPPYGFGHSLVVGGEAALGGSVDEIRGGAGEQRRPFIDLVERIGAHHQRRFATVPVDHGLREGEQRLP